MEPITSGSTTERIVRTSLITVLSIGAAAWCFYDAYIHYPMENLERAVSDLTPRPEISLDLISPEVNEDAVKSIDPQMFLKDLTARFGETGWRGKNAKGGNQARFFGTSGQIIVNLNVGDGVIKAIYEQSQYHSQSDLVFQVWMGIVVSVIVLLLVFHWFRVVIVKTTMTDEGIKQTVRPLVPFDAMTEMRAEHYAKKGWLEVDYEMDGRTGTFRLDDYKIKAFPEIIAEVCRRKDWEDPYKKWKEKKNTGAPSSKSEPKES